jgi:exodeoxyribonuclease VIII
MKHVMLDIETLGREPDGVIIQIGISEVNLSPVKDRSFQSWNVKPESCMEYGMTLDLPTIRWWAQPERVGLLNSILSADAFNLPLALDELQAWVDWGSLEGVWSNAPRFDFGILRTAYALTGMECPWTYRQERCARTMFYAASKMGHELKVKRRGPKHEAGFDALYQAQIVEELWEYICGE